MQLMSLHEVIKISLYSFLDAQLKERNQTQPKLNFLQSSATKSHSKYPFLEVFLLNQNLAAYVEIAKHEIWSLD